MLTLTDIIEIEPQIKPLLETAKLDQREDRSEAYSEYKAELIKLCGWGCQNPKLRTHQSYTRALDALCFCLNF